jgi:hypothetical protein
VIDSLFFSPSHIVAVNMSFTKKRKQSSLSSPEREKEREEIIAQILSAENHYQVSKMLKG